MSNQTTPTASTSDSNPTLQRFSITVPMPKAWFVMGFPDDLGYQGVSLGADDNAFLSVKGSTLTQAKGQVMHMAWKEWMQSSGNDMTYSTGANQFMGAKRQIVLAAGAGYAPDLQLENGTGLPSVLFNTYDYRQIIEPCRNGVRSYDESLKGTYDGFLDAIGLPGPPPAIPGAAAASWKLSLLKLLCGLPLPPTENSESIEQFARKHAGLMGLLEKLKSVTDRLERWTSRPDTLPLVGPLIDAGKSLQLAMQGVTNAAAALAALPVDLGLAPSPDGGKSGIGNEYAREMDEAEDKNALIEHGAAGKTWVDQGGAAAELTGTGFQHLLRPIANRIRTLSYALNGMCNGIEAIANLLGIPRTQALALVGKDGVSLISPKRVFGYAADGFHFVSADTEIEPPSKWDILDKIQMAGDEAQEKLKELLLGPTIKPKTFPGFHIRSEGDVDTRTEGDVRMQAIGSLSRAVMTSNAATEVSSVGPVGLSSRGGSAEVLGKTVTLGSTVDRAQKSILMLPLGAPLKAANEAYATGMKEAADAEEDFKKKSEKLRLLTVDGTYRLDPLKTAEAVQLRAEVAALEAVFEAKQTAVYALESARNVAFTAYRAATMAAALKSDLAKAMQWKDGAQAFTEKIEMGATETLDVFSKTVTVGSSDKVAIKCEPIIPDPLKSAKLEVSDQVEIQVGPLFSILVTSSKITIKAQGQEIVTTDGVETSIVSSGSTVKLGPTGVAVNGAKLSLNGLDMAQVRAAMIQLG